MALSSPRKGRGDTSAYFMWSRLANKTTARHAPKGQDANPHLVRACYLRMPGDQKPAVPYIQSDTDGVEL
jgi:hypothetical protein